jgi:hypothetical protein
MVNCTVGNELLKEASLAWQQEWDSQLADISAFLEHFDSIVPPKEFRTWVQIISLVTNAPSYQYVQMYVLPVVGMQTRRIYNIKIYIIGFMYYVGSMLELFVEAVWGAPNNHQPIEDNGGNNCATWCGPDQQAGGDNAAFENNLDGIARGTHFWYSGSGMTEQEIVFINACLNPFPAFRPRWLGPRGEYWTLGLYQWRIEGTWEVIVYAPNASPAIQNAGGWVTLDMTPDSTTCLSALWRYAQMNQETALLLPAFVIAAVMCGTFTVVSAFGRVVGTRMWFSAAQEWRRVQLPKPNGSQNLKAEVGWAIGKSESLKCPFYGLATSLIIGTIWVIWIQFHLSSSVYKYICGCVGQTFSSANGRRLQSILGQRFWGMGTRAPGSTAKWRVTMGSTMKAIFDVFPQRTVVELPALPNDDLPDFNAQPNWSNYSVRGVGFFPIRSVQVASLCVKWPPTLIVPVLGLSSAVFMHLVTSFGVGNQIPQAVIPAWEENAATLVVGLIPIAYWAAVVIFDWVNGGQRQFETKSWIYQQSGSRFQTNPTDQLMLPVVNVERDELGLLKEGQCAPWQDDGTLQLWQFRNRPAVIPDGVNPEAAELERKLTHKSEETVFKRDGYINIIRTRHGQGQMDLPLQLDMAIEPVGLLDEEPVIVVDTPAETGALSGSTKPVDAGAKAGDQSGMGSLPSAAPQASNAEEEDKVGSIGKQVTIAKESGESI